MLLQPQDLDELSDVLGSKFEAAMNALIRAEANRIGLSPQHVSADERTNIGDGGCDLRTFANDKESQLIPEHETVWSFKSGIDGVSVSSLKNEIAKHLPGDCLSRGGHYIWCARLPIKEPKRQKMKAAVEDVAIKNNFSPDQVTLLWRDQLCEYFKRFPNVVFQHMPLVARRFEGVYTFNSWREQIHLDAIGFSKTWVPLEGREGTIATLRSQLQGDRPTVPLHVTGLSGIGKTRTVMQACLRDPDSDIQHTLYAPRYDKLNSVLMSWLELPETNCGLVLDEVPIDEYEQIHHKFRQFGDRVRLVTIGPSPRVSRVRHNDPALLQLRPPDLDGKDMRQFVTAISQDRLTQREIDQIITYSGRDFRMAVLLVEAAQRSGGEPLFLGDSSKVWKRIRELFKHDIQNPAVFDDIYQFLTLAVDIGWRGSHSREVEIIAKLFSQNLTALHQTIRDSIKCGLGDTTEHFFEAKPRALANWFFEDRLWQVLQPHLNTLADATDADRLVRRFLDRCNELDPPFREEVQEQIQVFFLRRLGKPRLLTISQPDAARSFQAWAEFDPQSGLNWLKQAVESASDSDLEQFDGAAGIFGSWGGRRYIVWLCEHLACFAEYFYQCEAILFRLAQVETEVQIANNSTGTWREMFLPILANTEVSFYDRLDLLLRRLQSATQETISLVLSGFGAAMQRSVMQQQPPSVVGGRIVPEQWRPQTHKELEDCRQNAAATLLDAVSEANEGISGFIIEHVIEHLGEFLFFDLGGRLKTVLNTAEGTTKRNLIKKLDDWLSWHQGRVEHEKQNQLPPWHGDIQAWRDELSPRSLVERVHDLLSRDVWEVRRYNRRIKEDFDEAHHQYEKLAKEILSKPDVFSDLRPWLPTKEAKSAWAFMSELGRADREQTLTRQILDWLAREASATTLVAHYLSGLTAHLEGLPKVATEAIEAISETRPRDALEVTAIADVSQQGAERLIRLLQSIPDAGMALLQQLGGERWLAALNPTQQEAILRGMLERYQEGSEYALLHAFSIVSMWLHFRKSLLNNNLDDVLLEMLVASESKSVGAIDYEWEQIVEHLTPVFPKEIASLLAREIANIETRRYERRKYAIKHFKLLARENPETAMEAIGEHVMGEKGDSFRIFEAQGIFDAIGLETVKPWIEKQGQTAALRIARSLDGPTVKDGKPHIPELADWLLTKFASYPKVFSEFAMGRHSMEVRWGYAKDREVELKEFLEKFSSYKQPWVQKWVDYEWNEHEFEVDRERRMEEERDRL